MSAIWIVLAVVMSMEALVTLFAAFRFRSFFLRRAGQAPSQRERWPKTAVLAPCKGLDEGFEANVQSWLGQDYPDYSVFFVVESEQDPALEVLRTFNDARILIAGQSTHSGQKIHNLACAILQLPAEYEALAFVDSDTRVQAGWLRSLVAMLIEHPQDAATGYRWFDSSGAGPAGRLQAAWNSSVLTLFEESGKRNFAWGGSMAILRRTFDETSVLKYWEGSLSDDYALTNALHAANRRVHFVPQAISLTRDSSTFADFFSWAGRQLLITRLYFPHLWRMAFVFHVVWVLWLAGIFVRPWWVLGSFLLVQTIQGMKANLRLQCVEAIWPQRSGRRTDFWLLSPVVGFSNFLMLSRNLLSRRVRWRGVQYEVLGRNRLRRL